MKKEVEILKFAPCRGAVVFRANFDSFETAWEQCPRGDWMLWIAKKLEVDLLKSITAKALCANTVRHLMQDERSTRAVDVAILFGKGLATREQLKQAAYAAAAAADAADAAYAAAAYAAAAAADAAYAAYAAAAYAAAAADVRKENQLKTADICRQVLTDVVFEKIRQL